MFLVYLLELVDNRFYVGITEWDGCQVPEVVKRWTAHEKGKGGSKWTAHFKPLKNADGTLKAHIVGDALGNAEAEKMELALTVEAMRETHWILVRGGIHVQMCIEPPREIYSEEKRKQFFQGYGRDFD